MSNAGSRSCLTIVLAAGEGKRMMSAMPKVLHPVAGLPMVCHVMQTAEKAGSSAIAVVVGNKAQEVSKAVQGFDEKAQTFLQTERLGTAHAVLAARTAIENDIDDVLVLYGDVPLIRSETIDVARRALAESADIVVLGFHTNTPKGYGRLLMDGEALTAIREDKDASDEERKINYCNSGIMAFKATHMLSVLDAIGNDNVQGEYYLTDAVEKGRELGLNVVAVDVPEQETLGVNTPVQLAEVEAIWQERKRHDFLLKGVTMTAPHTVFFHHDTRVESGATFEPNVVCAEKVQIEEGAVIRAFSHLEGAYIGPHSVVGPYARLRPGTHLEKECKIGNFVETKATHVERGAKINHLSYIGDAFVGEKANIGAGTITCNYDGYGKHKTTIGAGAFIGSNTALIAPVTVGEKANTAAGSAIYDDIAADDLGIERNEQANLRGKAKELRQRYAAQKATQGK